jgi:hypothetical protein
MELLGYTWQLATLGFIAWALVQLVRLLRQGDL